MRLSLYNRLSWTNIRKNAKLYVPCILTGSGLLSIFYIIMCLVNDENLMNGRGGAYLRDILPLGAIIIGLMSFILILYTNSFLMKQRDREFGLYNVLGMEKGHIGSVMFCETLICIAFVLVIGIVCGIVFYKLFTLLICKIMSIECSLGFSHITMKTILIPAAFFACIYLLTFIINRIHISRMKVIELLQSTKSGEKEPRVKILLLLIGVVALSAGYYISITTKKPLSAIELFFLAVILVIIGTYALFITGTTAVLKILKAKRNYYYQKKHMIAVSGLLYRMKQNAVGLASITILATMVLVMVSTTVSMYVGINDSIKVLYPKQFYVSYRLNDDSIDTAKFEDSMKASINDSASRYDVDVKDIAETHYFQCVVSKKGNPFRSYKSSGRTDFMQCWFITADEYERATADRIDLDKNQIAVFENKKNVDLMPTKLQLGETTYDCSERIDSYPIVMTRYSLCDNFGCVVSDTSVLNKFYELQKRAYKEYASPLSYIISFNLKDTTQNENVYINIGDDILNQLEKTISSNNQYDGSIIADQDNMWQSEKNAYVMYGSLLFLGLLLSLVFIFATALIIYFKQISEGYDDRSRFQIMQKIGMSHDEVSDTIRSQIMLVFFLPLIVAAVHVSFAFPFLTRILGVFMQPNMILFLACTGASLLAFAVIYTLIYRITAKLYYQIVKY